MKTKKEVTEACISILDRYLEEYLELDQLTRGYYIKLSKKDERFVREVLKCHPSRDWSKEIVEIGVGPNFGMFDPYVCRCFYAIFEDGSYSNFSFHKCISNMNKEQVNSIIL